MKDAPKGEEILLWSPDWEKPRAGYYSLRLVGRYRWIVLSADAGGCNGLPSEGFNSPQGWLPLPDPATGLAPVVTEEMVEDASGTFPGSRISASDVETILTAALPHAKTEAEVEDALLERLCALLEDYDPDAADWVLAKKAKSDE
jgi:hypothetical protein